MAALTLRNTKGSPLTNAELDGNFTALNTELGQKLVASLNLSDLVNAGTARTNLGIGNVENKSSATIRGEISSANVTTALGFTPYNSTNPNGYITSAALTSYLPLSGGDMSGRIRMGTFSSSTLNTGEAWIGRASDRLTGTATVQLGNSADRMFEVVDNLWSTVIFAAGMNTFTYKGSSVLHAGNYNSYAPTLTGTGASGTWGISITGNAATISGQANSATITASTGVNADNIVRRDASGYIYANHINFNTGESENPTISSFITSNGDGWSRKSTLSHAMTSIRGVASGTWGINVTGNAATASAVAWSGVSSKPSNLMAYQGFTLDANTMDSNATGFTYGLNAPYTGPIVRFAASGYDLWLNAPYNGGGNGLRFRTRNGDSATLNAWKDLLHEGNYSSYALPLSGGTLSGTVNAPNFVNSANSNFGIFGNNGYFDTVNGRGSDPLELNYFEGGAVKIGSGTYGSKELYAVGIYDNGSRVLSQQGSSYYQVNTWLQANGSYGLYWPNHYGAHIHANDLSSYTPIAIRGAKGGYQGIAMQNMPEGGGNGHWMSNGNTTGYYNESYGWKFFHQNGDFYIYSGTYGGGTQYTALHSGNYNSYSPTLTGGSASGTWGISVTGNAGTAYGLNVHTARNNEANKVVRTDGNGYLQVGYINSSNGNEGNNSNPSRVWGTNGSDDYLRTYLTSALSVAYAVTAGTIGGTATIFGLSVSGQNTGYAGKAGPEVTGQGSGGAVWSMHRPGAYGLNMGLDSDNVFRIGGWSAAVNRLQMDMTGNLTMNGNVTAYSDERLKTNWRPLPADFLTRFAAVKHGAYERIDSGATQVGVSAQSLREVMPEAIMEGSDGMLSVAYGNAALAACVALAKEVTSLREELNALKLQLAK